MADDDNKAKEGSTKIMPCNCASSFQNARYGPGLRVHNIGKGSPQKKTCTVCGKEK